MFVKILLFAIFFFPEFSFHPNFTNLFLNINDDDFYPFFMLHYPKPPQQTTNPSPTPQQKDTERNIIIIKCYYI
jgi:hypothetical protein